MLSGRMTREDRDAYQAGRDRFDRGDADAALLQLEPLAERYPGYADVQYMLAVLRERQGEIEVATTLLERALRINPRYTEAALALKSLYEQQGHHERSRELSEQLAENATGPGFDATTRGKLANLQAAMGDAYREAGEPREAVLAYRKALERCPNFHDIRQRLAISLREAALPSQAITEFKRVLRANPRYLEARVQLGLTHYTLGRLAAAREEWNAALEQDPSCDEARMYLRMAPGAGVDRADAAEESEPASDT
jgi:tetratricopeptide (TPR) repeat protein